MCGIAGFVNEDGGYLHQRTRYVNILEKMKDTLRHRGPCSTGIFLDQACGFSHVRLSILDLEGGKQPMHYYFENQCFTLCYNGEIYNMTSLKNELLKQGIPFETNCDTEVLLKGYAKEGPSFFQKLNGIYAFAIWEHKTRKLLLCRDRLGVKPLFYTQFGETLIFSSEIKGILSFPGIRPIVGAAGLCELLALGPAHTPGKCVYEDVFEVLPGHYMEYQEHCLTDYTYWKLTAAPHQDTVQETIEHTRYLVEDSIHLQMLSDIPICTFLSGGLDSSIVSAICANKLKESGKTLATYSFDFTNNQEHYIPNSFQPSLDAPYVNLMVQYTESNHQELFCSNDTLIEYLFHAVDGRDYPCMADVEASLAYFCKCVSAHHKVALTGECADEIFGGYPWFYREELLSKKDFPWSYDMTARSSLLNASMCQLPLYEYSHNAYQKTIASTPLCEDLSPTEQLNHQMQYLNFCWFMATLLERMDRTSMQAGLEARVPFADHRIIEYLYNVPWKLKAMGNQEKGLLRKAMEGILPESILYRKKSPYPKTYHPEYEQRLKQLFMQMLQDPQSRILEIVDKNKAYDLITSKLQYTKPWYGQLMAGPQLLAYFIQIDYWLRTKDIELKL